MDACEDAWDMRAGLMPWVCLRLIIPSWSERHWGLFMDLNPRSCLSSAHKGMVPSGLFGPAWREVPGDPLCP